MKPRRSVLIVGVGSIGERHLRCFAATGRTDVSFCEPNPALRQTISDRYKVGRSFENLQPALAAKPEITVICTPANTHVPLALDAIRAGSHVLIEKPLSTNFQSIDTLEQALAGAHLTGGVAYVYRANPALAAMREALAGGRFGRAVEMVAVCGQHFPHYRPAYRQTYYRDRKTGGGAVQDALTHIINAGEWLVGPVTSLVADVGHQLLPEVEVEDTVHVLTRHQTVMGSFSLNQHQAPNESTITVACERGTVRFESHHCRWRWQDDPAGQWHDESTGKWEADTLFTRQASSFLDAVDSGGKPLCTIAEAAQTLRVNLAILDSAEKRSWQTIRQCV